MLPLTETEGEVTHMDVRNRHMAVATSTSMIKVLDVSRRTFKQVGMTKRFEKKKNGDLIGEIKAIFLNPDGKKLCILSDQAPIPSIKIPDTKFYIYDVESEAITEAEVGYNRVPIEAFWDQEDPRLLAIETEYIKDISRATMDEDHLQEEDSKAEADYIPGGLFKEEKEEWTGKTVETFFVTRDYGTKKQDSLRFEDGEETLLGIQVPYFFHLGQAVVSEEDAAKEEENKDSNNPTNLVIHRKPMRDFGNLINLDEETKKAILDFSFYLTCGNMDEAYNSVRNVQNIHVWQIMAQMCVKNKRLDVAQICLGNMRFARAAKAAREVEGEKEIEAQLAMVALQLGMIDDAKQLYKDCGRYDLLCQMLQASGNWDEVLEVAEKHNRINLKNTHY